MKNLILFTALLISTSICAQNKECGYKEQCECDTLSESIEYSFKISDVIIEGIVLKTDTISISEIITPLSLSTIKNDTLLKSQCAKSVLKLERVIKATIGINEEFKGDIKKKEIYILTPLKIESCGYSYFKLNTRYVIYATQNETVDIYFLWTFDADYFHLKPKYTYWTNKCKRTGLSNNNDLEELRKIRKSFIKNKHH